MAHHIKTNIVVHKRLKKSNEMSRTEGHETILADWTSIRKDQDEIRKQGENVTVHFKLFVFFFIL